MAGFLCAGVKAEGKGRKRAERRKAQVTLTGKPVKLRTSSSATRLGRPDCRCSGVAFFVLVSQRQNGDCVVVVALAILQDLFRCLSQFGIDAQGRHGGGFHLGSFVLQLQRNLAGLLRYRKRAVASEHGYKDSTLRGNPSNAVRAPAKHCRAANREHLTVSRALHFRCATLADGRCLLSSA